MLTDLDSPFFNGIFGSKMNSYLQRLINDKLSETESLDLTKKEDVDKFNDSIDKLRENSESFDEITKLLTGQTWNEMLDKIQKIGNEPYEKILADEKVKQLEENKVKLNNAINKAWGIEDKVDDTIYNKVAKEKYNTAADIIKKQVDKTNQTKKVEPTLPSSLVDEKHLNQIKSLVSEYSEKMIEPYWNGKAEYLNSANEGLIEFACWLLNHK